MASAGSAFEVRAIVPNKVEEQRLRRLLCLRRLLWGRTRTISGCASMEMLRFGDVVLDVGRGLLRDSKGAEVALRPKSLDLLLELASKPGHILSRDELFDAVWPDVTVTEDSIAQCVHEVRRAIGDPEGRILRTIVKRGYCLDVEESVPPTAAPRPLRRSMRPAPRLPRAGRRWSSCRSRAFPTIRKRNGSPME
jgi:DNA-binding winged helix-turn-helix (wHTH) protein